MSQTHTKPRALNARLHGSVNQEAKLQTRGQSTLPSSGSAERTPSAVGAARSRKLPALSDPPSKPYKP